MATKPKKHPRRETELYAPIRDYLVEQGYTVHSEVLGCDITATREEELIVIELKRSFSMKLLLQGTQRQRLSDSVYIAIPRPNRLGWDKKWRQIQHLLKRLELGLIVVAFDAEPPRVDVAFHPVPFRRRKEPKKRRAVLREMAGRSGDRNEGGSTGRKIITAYRENAIKIAWHLSREESLSPKELRALGTGPKTTPILYGNVYGWFERLGHARYGLTEKGRNALPDYADITDKFPVPPPK
jgi:hypothetical protein